MKINYLINNHLIFKKNNQKLLANYKNNFKFNKNNNQKI